MSCSVEPEKVENLEFKWGKKRGVGGKKKEVQFYESFTYDGVEYIIHDCVYLYKEGEPEPYIGKIIKIWENPDKTKKVKVLWFFRPCEILNCLGDEETLENELFLASGEGVGLANVNALEAIAGKCNIVCISKDNRNPQPSEEELRKADFVFYRTFDVGRCTILDKIDDKVAGIEVKFIFNRSEFQKSGSVPKLHSNRKEDCGIAVANNETLILTKQNLLKEHENVKRDKNNNDPSSKEDAVVKVSLIKHTLREIPDSDANVKLGEMATTSVKQESVLEGKTSMRSKVDSNKGEGKVGEMATTRVKQESVFEGKTTLRSKVDSDKREDKVGKVLVNQVEVGERVKSLRDSGDMDDRPSKKAKVEGSIEASGSEDKNRNTIQKLTIDSERNDAKATVVTAAEHKMKSLKDSGELNDRPSKKAKVDGSVKLSRDNNRNILHKLSIDSDGDNVKTLPFVTTAEDKITSKLARDSLGLDKGLSKKLKADEKISNLSNGKLLKASVRPSLDEDGKTGSQVMEVTRRPDADRSRWFKGLPWEERMQTADKQGTLVLLENLDPAYTSAEVEDIVWHGFKENCTAKMIQRTAITSPHSGQAFVIFKTREAAEKAVRKLNEGCLMLSNGRPLVGSIATPYFPGKESTLIGHLYIDKVKLQMQREMKEAVSTSHCSQPNTIEYEMAMEWCLLQERSDSWWKKLYKRQGEDLRKLKAELKSK